MAPFIIPYSTTRIFPSMPSLQVIAMESPVTEQIITGSVVGGMGSGIKEDPWVGTCSSDFKQPVGDQWLNGRGVGCIHPHIHPHLHHHLHHHRHHQ